MAISGGVDSSVAAALLKKQGYNVTGVFFKPWQPGNGMVFCNWKQDRLDAQKTAVKLNIPFLTWDFSDEYNQKVANYMIGSYKKGITPNPDVMCNKKIKFGTFLKKALESDADFIATGHYARLRREFSNKKGNYQLSKAKDKNKDQSYFLWTLKQDQLKHCLFPIGDYTKPEVRKLAKNFGLPNWNKKDSQGVCFVGEMDMKEFLKDYIKPRAGLVKNIRGEIIGSHEGTEYYTIGQRHGFTILKEGPYFVTGKDIKKNILIVDKIKKSDKKVTVQSVSWVGKMHKLPTSTEVKIRYRHNSQKAEICKLARGNGPGETLVLKFRNPQISVTPGQSAVFYKGEELLGGGIIA